MSIKHFLLWLPMIAIAFANAALREMVFLSYVNEYRAHQLSTLTLIILCGIYVWLVFPVLGIQSSKQAIFTGVFWMLLTVAFEFLTGRLANKSWEYLFENYNIFAGRIWLLFLLCLSMLPYLLYRLSNKH